MTALSSSAAPALLAADSSSIPPDVAREAVQWLLDLRAEDAAPDSRATLHTELRTERSTSVRAEWSRWLAADPLHQLAWQRIELVNQQLRGASSPLAAAVAQAGLRSTPNARRRRAVKALAALVFASGTAWLVERRTPWREMTADLRSGVGERRTTQLADGTEAMLNTASAINVRFDAAQRRLQLLAGEVLITTAHDSASPARPFLVETRHGEALALGTQFIVRQDEHATRVAVLEGAVQIRPGQASAPLLLRAGQQAGFSTAGATEPTPADKQAAIAWTQGTIMALSMRLGDFVQELGRYTDQPLSCDATVADLRISGSYPTGNVNAAMRGAAQALSLQLEVVDRFWGPQAVRISRAAHA